MHSMKSEIGLDYAFLGLLDYKHERKKERGRVWKKRYLPLFQENQRKKNDILSSGKPRQDRINFLFNMAKLACPHNE